MKYCAPKFGFTHYGNAHSEKTNWIELSDWNLHQIDLFLISFQLEIAGKCDDLFTTEQ